MLRTKRENSEAEREDQLEVYCLSRGHRPDALDILPVARSDGHSIGNVIETIDDDFDESLLYGVEIPARIATDARSKL